MNKANRSFKIMLAYYDNSSRATIFSSLLLSQYITGFAETTKIVLKKITGFSINQASSQLESFQPSILPTHIASALPQLNQYNSSSCLYYMHYCHGHSLQVSLFINNVLSLTISMQYFSCF